MGTGTWVWVPVFMAIFFNSLGSGQNVTVTNSPDPSVIQALGSVASLVEEPCAPEKKMENGSRQSRLPFFRPRPSLIPLFRGEEVVIMGSVPLIFFKDKTRKRKSSRGFRFFVRNPLLSPCVGGGRIKKWGKICFFVQFTLSLQREMTF